MRECALKEQNITNFSEENQKNLTKYFLYLAYIKRTTSVVLEYERTISRRLHYGFENAILFHINSWPNQSVTHLPRGILLQPQPTHAMF